ncbi:hypothetical protein, partial [Serratia marcescens]|uniref:hypothetical protein n=1 Tax=Serratia marcescens TaxID=615 RepID=UPI002761C374
MLVLTIGGGKVQNAPLRCHFRGICTTTDIGLIEALPSTECWMMERRTDRYLDGESVQSVAVK